MTIGVSGGLLALASAVHGRYLVGIIAALLATFFMPEVALIFPGLLALGLRAICVGFTSLLWSSSKRITEGGGSGVGTRCLQHPSGCSDTNLAVPVSD